MTRRRETERQRRERRRAEQLRKIEEQVAAGRLVVRQPTAEERERYGIRNPQEALDAGS